jgi:hypothetical protein
VRVGTIVSTQELDQQPIDLRNPAVELLAANVDHELPATERSHQAAGFRILLQDCGSDAGLGQPVSGCESGRAGTNDQGVDRLDASTGLNPVAVVHDHGLSVMALIGRSDIRRVSGGLWRPGKGS